MRYSSDHKAETRERVLKEAANEIRAKGPDNVAVSGIMARAGLTHGGFYAHFPSKDALVKEAIGTMFADARARSDKIDADGDPRDVLRAYIDFYLSPAHRDRRDRGCPLPTLSGDFARSQPETRERFGAGVVGIATRLAAPLAKLGYADPDAEAHALLAQLVGGVALARAVGDAALSDALLADTHASIVRRYSLETAQ
ncbi:MULTISPECIES: TetR/AcrR family transcriptional regulator [unclassified Sphingopyxis]|uniref:TetR/AcrR family transcriptional regulator n=1 Tax=unclassified Sphingopyxis TaxID=2614943 RepID=UPI00072FB81B|nr:MULTISPECIES: TetR/AcrR family transcriptional regulator [unclassified Sphingopyxis]KTE23885.1 TetR family transcriptional regulator [Sphingopyxis sp. H057]KTE51038.1 TetR family transcriptional regulator [Sphingopyxis sp. H073]KTE51249.1 TetR family transcriptional regulator [Sphingopyxis sp. H071]KTE58844.1 TetR family transcriptional regulator [Sphingopyxis sp. H107]KTE61235.1 TetR family transcriptional regulator [Sphingopyxis sp. H100]